MDLVSFGMRIVGESDVGYYSFCYSSGDSGSYDRLVCPAVYLKSDIELIGNSEDGWTIVKD